MTTIEFIINPIGYVSSPYKQRFGIPRQSGLIDEAEIEIKLNPNFSMNSVKGLADFEYIWVQFIFHATKTWSELVRPPRLGGNTKMGVFATRSPHRPNHLGLSLLKLNSIKYHNKQVHLFCDGADLLDQTPIVDIKPYLTFIEAKQSTKNGFINGKPIELKIKWLLNPWSILKNKTEIKLIEKSISQDPRPAYQNNNDKIYVMHIINYKVYFQVINNCALITQINLLI